MVLDTPVSGFDQAAQGHTTGWLGAEIDMTDTTMTYIPLTPMPDLVVDGELLPGTTGQRREERASEMHACSKPGAASVKAWEATVSSSRW